MSTEVRAGSDEVGVADRSETVPAPDIAIPPAKEEAALYINRELSWLDFNRRVLEDAADPRHPLLERVKFLSIFNSNLDEFFMIRVSGLKEQVQAGLSEEGPDGLTVSEQLREIRKVIMHHVAEQRRLLTAELLPRLAEQGIRVVEYWDLQDHERETSEGILRA